MKTTTYERMCPDCEGSGTRNAVYYVPDDPDYVDADVVDCETCDGSGTVTITRKAKNKKRNT